MDVNQPIDMRDVHQLEKAIRSCFNNVMKRDAPSNETDFFGLGMDSLQVTYMTRQLRGVIRDPRIEAAVV